MTDGCRCRDGGGAGEESGQPGGEGFLLQRTVHSFQLCFCQNWE